MAWICVPAVILLLVGTCLAQQTLFDFPYQPLKWLGRQGYGNDGGSSLQPILFNEKSMFVLASGENFVAWTISTREVVYNETALPTFAHCSMTTVGCAIIWLEQLTSTTAVWYAYDTFGTLDLITGTFGYRVSTPGHVPVLDVQVFAASNIFVLVFAPNSNDVEVCGYSIDSGAKLWCHIACNDACHIRVGDYNNQTHVLYIATGDAVQGLNISTNITTVIWMTNITDSLRSNGPILVPNRTEVLFVDGVVLNVYNALTGHIVANATVTMGDNTAKDVTLDIYEPNKLLALGLYNFTNYYLDSLEIISFNESVATTVGAQSYAIVNKTYLFGAGINYIYGFDLRDMESGVLWMHRYSGTISYEAEVNRVIVASQGISLWFFEPLTGQLTIRCAVEGGQFSPTLPVYLQADDTWLFGTVDNYVVQCIGESVVATTMNNGYQYGSMKKALDGTSLIVTPGDWHTGMRRLDIATWQWDVVGAVVQNTFTYDHAMELLCGPNGESMTYLITTTQLDTTQYTSMYAYYTKTMAVAWHVLNMTFSPMAAKDCFLYVGDQDNTAYKYNALDGSLVWSCYVLPDNTFNQQGFENFPAVFGSVVDHVYFLSADSTLTAISISTGKIQWKTTLKTLTGKIFQPVAVPITYNSKVYVSHPNNAMFYQVDEATGTINFEDAYPTYASPVVYDNKVYFICGAVQDYGIAWFEVSTSQVLYMHLSEGQFDLQGPTVTPDGVMLMVSLNLYSIYLPERKLLWSYKGQESLQAFYGANGYVYGIFFGIQVFHGYTGELMMQIPHDSMQINNQAFTLTPATPSNLVSIAILQGYQLFRYQFLPLPMLTPPTMSPGWTPFPPPSPPGPSTSTPQGPNPPGPTPPGPNPPGPTPPGPNPPGPTPPGPNPPGPTPPGPNPPGPTPPGPNPPGPDSGSGATYYYTKSMSTSFVGLPVTFAVLFIAAFTVFSLCHKQRYRPTGKPSEAMLAEILVIHSDGTV